MLEELSDEEGTIEVGASGAAGDATLELEADVPAPMVDVAICDGVEVEETNGGAFSMYEPDGWTA